MSRGRRIAVVALGALAAILILIVAALFMLTSTDWGREKARLMALERIRASVNGELNVGRVQGHLLDEVRLIDVSIVDSAGRPFLRADTIEASYSLRGLISQRIRLSDLVFKGADVVLDRPPGEDWNFVSIFRSDSQEPSSPSAWGEWIELRDIRLTNSNVTMRTEWEPPPDLSPAEEREAIRKALAGETRDNVVEVAGGFQNVMKFRDLNAEFARILIAHPDSAAIPIDIESFSGIAEPFNPPAAVVRDLSGSIRFQGDSLLFRGLEARLSESRMTFEGFYSMEHSDLSLELDGSAIALKDLRFLQPDLPKEGGGSLRLDLRLRPLTKRIVAREMDLRIGESTLAGRLDVMLGDTLRVQDTNLQFARLDTRLIQDLAPAVAVPRHGLLTGSVALDGEPADLRVNADVTFADHAGGSSRVLAGGRLSAEDDMRFRGLEVRMQPLQIALVRAFAPDIPVRGGTVEGRALLTGSLQDRIDLESNLVLRDPQSGVSRVAATGGIVFGEPLRLDAMRLRFDPLQLDLLPSDALPAGATASGPVILDGALGGLLRVDGDLTISDPASGVSRVAATGGIALGDELRFADLSVRLDPLQTGLVRAVDPDFPLGGIVAGTATLNGSPSQLLVVNADLVHEEAGERSHVTGGGEIAFGGASPRLDLDLSLDPLSLNTVGRFAPQAGLHGYAAGNLSVNGTPTDFGFTADLSFGDGGSVDASGRVDLAGAEPAYDVQLTADMFNPAAVSTRAPVTTPIVGTASAKGVGLDPATMNATFLADFRGLEVGDYEADEVHLQVSIDEGLASVAPSRIRMRAAEAEIEGSFGLVAGREGTLVYRIRTDSLGLFAPWLPAAPDTAVVPPRPAVRAAALAASERAAENARVAFLATGELPDIRRDTLPPLIIPSDSLAGRIDASGTIRGNVERFDADGQAVVERLIYQGNYVERAEVDYSVSGFGQEDLELTAEGAFETMLLGGYAVESATIDASYRGGRYGSGDVAIAVRRDDASDLNLDANFLLSLEGNELQLGEMELRLDTVRWATTGPAAVQWGADRVSVDHFEMQNNAGARIYLDGNLPVEGAADLELVVTDLEIGQLADLIQSDQNVTGLLSLDAHLIGTLQDPQIDGRATLLDAAVDGELVADVFADIVYADEVLRADAELVRDSLQVATADARIPINLAFGDGGPQLLDRPMQIDVRADELPLDMLPAFTDQVEAAEGSFAANVSITGTPIDPIIEGDISLDVTSIDVVPLGVRFEPLIGHASLSGDVLRIDSLIAYSDGPARISGEVTLETLTNPVFDLDVEARDTWVIDTDDARLQVDADLSIDGPLESVVVSGLVRTRRGVIYVPEMSEFGAAEVVDLDDPATFDRLDSLLQAQREIVAGPSPVFQNIEADIQVEIDRDVWLRSTEANVEIYTPSDVGPMRVSMRGLQDLPTIEGTINTDRGEYEYLSRRFTLTRGSVSFTGEEEINPLLQLAAEHEVRIPGREALTIRIIVGGTLRDLEITLESNAQPPISQTDLLSFLAFGREASSLIQGHGSSLSGQGSSGTGLVGNVAGIATQQFTAIALESMVTGLEADIGQDLGLDVIRITPASLPADVFTGSYLDVLRGTEIEAGRYVTSRLFVAAQARPARTFPGLRFEYRTRRDFEFTASWRTRFVSNEPTLRDPQPRSVGVFGSFLFKEWRF